MKDYLNQEIKIGDRAIRTYVYSHSTEFKKCTITDIDNGRKYRDTVKILTDGNSKEGWTYPYRLITENSFNVDI